MDKNQAKATVGDFINHLSYVRKLSHNTLRAYKTDLANMMAFWQKNKSLSFQNAIKNFLTSLLYNQQLKNSSISRTFSCFKTFKNYLEERSVYLDLSVKPLKIEKKLPEVLSESEMLLLLNLSSTDIKSTQPLREAAILEVLYSTGIRCQELVNLKVSDIDLNEKTMNVSQGKGSKDRIAIFGKYAEQKLQIYLEKERCLSENPSDYLFISRQGSRLSTRMIQNILTLFSPHLGGKNITPHMIRHSCATHFLARGANLRAVQILLGHTSLNTTELYTQVSSIDLKNFLDKNHPIQKGKEEFL